MEDKAELGGHLVPVKGKVEAKPTCGRKCQDTPPYPSQCMACACRVNSEEDRQGSIKVRLMIT